MTKTNDASMRIYTDVLDQIHGTFSALDQNVYQDQSRGEHGTAKRVLGDIEQVLHQRVTDLGHNAEWNTFTVAFYGEANAGKSTLVECLRILLKESSNVEQRQHFRALQKQFGLYEHDLNLLEQQSDKFVHRQAEAQQKMAEADRQYGQQETALTRKADGLRQHISDQKRSSGLLPRLRSLVRKLPEELTLKHVQRQLAQLPAQHSAALERLKCQQNEALTKYARIMRQHQTALDNRHQLEAYEDGRPLGDDTHSNAVDEMHSYTVEVNGRTFRMLDMPSIEYGDHPQPAIMCAHAVIYVTHCSPSAENDEEQNARSLAYIPAHLGAQTEVWMVFNKHVADPMVLRKASFISKEEQACLTELDSQMRAMFGRYYRRRVTLSALPGFLALADCLIPLSKKSLNRKRFVDALTTETLLQASGVDNFLQLLVQELPRDYDAKIKRANLHKVSAAITDVSLVIDQLSNEQFLPLQQDLHNEAEYACRQLDKAQQLFNEGVNAIGRQAIMSFGAQVRQQIAVKIEEDISNDDFEIALQAIMTTAQGAIHEHFPEHFDKLIEQFQQQVAAIIKRFELHANDILKAYEHTYHAMRVDRLALNIEGDCRTHFDGLMSSVAGSAQRQWRPIHWIPMSLGNITLLSGLFKSIWGYFSENYQQSQQYRAVEKNIRKAYRELSHSFQRSQRETLQPLKQDVEEIKRLLRVPERETKRLNMLICDAQVQLTHIANALVAKEGKA